jgi:DNA-directed RNA polymerase specialized sigma24 family protein
MITTSWTLLKRAAGEEDSPDVIDARKEICRRYYDTSHAFFTRKRGTHQADDYTQEFWLRLWTHWEPLNKADREKGKFSKFLYRRMVCFAKETLKSVKKPSREKLTSDVERDADNDLYKLDPDFLKDDDDALRRIAKEDAFGMLERDGKGYCIRVFELSRSGRTRSQIAVDLNISIETVRHAPRILRKCYRECVQRLVALDLGEDANSKEVHEETDRLCGPER